MNKDNIKEVKMEVGSLIDLISLLRLGASYTKHELSRGTIGDITPCDDYEVMEFLSILKEMKSGDHPAALVISNIEWENYGNCGGDELYPVIMEAQLLPGAKKRFYITISTMDKDYRGWDKKEYIWLRLEMNSCQV